MDLTNLHHGVQKLRRKKRVGRGVGSGHGKTSTRGAKGQWATPAPINRHRFSKAAKCPCSVASPNVASATPPGREIHLVVNIGDIDKAFAGGSTVDREALRKAGLANGSAETVRILGNGELTKKLIVRAHHFSKSAAEKIAAKGGTAEVIPPPKKPVRNKMKPRPPKE